MLKLSKCTRHFIFRRKFNRFQQNLSYQTVTRKLPQNNFLYRKKVEDLKLPYPIQTISIIISKKDKIQELLKQGEYLYEI